MGFSLVWGWFVGGEFVWVARGERFVGLVRRVRGEND